MDLLFGVYIQISLTSNWIDSFLSNLAHLMIRWHVALLLLEFYMFIFLLQLTVLEVVLQHLLEVHFFLL